MQKNMYYFKKLGLSFRGPSGVTHVAIPQGKISIVRQYSSCKDHSSKSCNRTRRASGTHGGTVIRQAAPSTITRTCSSLQHTAAALAAALLLYVHTCI